MINKIIASTLFVSALFALSLSIMGVQAPIQLGEEFRVFLATTSQDLEKYKFAIPDIPNIPEMESVSNGFLQVIDVLRQFINGIVNILNFVVKLINALIQLVEFAILLLKNIIVMRDKFITA